MLVQETSDARSTAADRCLYTCLYTCPYACLHTCLDACLHTCLYRWLYGIMPRVVEKIRESIHASHVSPCWNSSKQARTPTHSARTQAHSARTHAHTHTHSALSAEQFTHQRVFVGVLVRLCGRVTAARRRGLRHRRLCAHWLWFKMVMQFK